MSPASSSSIVTTAIFTVVLMTTGIRNGSSLKCYICSSLQNDACSSSLVGIEASTCTSDLSTTLTSVSDEATVIGETTGLTEDSSYTMETTDSSYTTEMTETVSLGTTKIDDLFDTTTMDISDANEKESGSEIYERSKAVEHYSCYKIVYHRNNTDVTERGCYISSSLPCSIMGEDETPDSKLKECQTCDQDACNSSLSIDLGPTFTMLSFMIFLLTRYTVSL